MAPYRLPRVRGGYGAAVIQPAARNDTLRHPVRMREHRFDGPGRPGRWRRDFLRLAGTAIVLIAMVPAYAGPQAPAGAPTVRLLDDFSPGWREAWKLQQLGGETTSYRAVREASGMILRAESNNAATALYRFVDVEAHHASVTWRWKVERSLKHGSEKERSGDDYAARLFVIFGPELFSRNMRALCYVWAGRETPGSSYRSPYVDTVQTIVLQSGDAKAGVWVDEAPDIAGDHRRAFGEEPVAISAIAIVVDTDNTGSRAVAWFDDLLIAARRQDQ